jgi:cobalt-zinc-cadmium resistance protein CzcA
MSKSALSQISIVFNDGTDIYFARQLVFERIASVRDSLPEGVEVELAPTSTGLGEIYQYTLESENHSAMELRTLQNWTVAPQLRVVPGVIEANSFGGFVKQYHVLVEPDRLLKYGITLNDVLEAIGKNNDNAGGNFLVKGWEQYYVRTVGLIDGMKDIENIVLKSADGTPVYLKDVAEVAIGPETRQGAVTRDGKGETVAGMVIMLKGANSKIVVESVKKQIARIQERLPAGVKINTFYDRTSLIEACTRTVRDAMLEGSIFVILVLFLFIAEFRTAMIVLVSLPLTFLISFVVMGGTGISSNLMTLGGLAFSVGMVVDASIVVIENVRRHLSDGQGRPVRPIIVSAVAEVASPVIFSVLIIVIILVPLFTLQGIEGKMFKPLAMTMLFALLISLVISMTIIPALAEWFIPRGPEREFGFIRNFHRGYLRFLELSVKHKWVTIGISLSVLLCTAALATRIGTEFMPPLDEGAIAINAVRLPTASLEGSVSVGNAIEKRLLSKFPEIKTAVTKTGRAEISEDPMGPEQSDIFLILHPMKEWRTGRNKRELVAAIQEDLVEIPGLRLSFSQPISLRVNELISGIKSDLAVKIFGQDLEKLREYGSRMAAVMQGIEGAQDVKVEQISGFTQIEIVPDRKEAARHKINLADINEIVETAVGGKVATQVVEGDKRFAVLVRFPEKYRNSIDAIGRILIHSPQGTSIPLSHIVQIREVEAPAQVSRENGMRRVVIESNVRGRDMGGFVSEVQKALGPVIKELPEGYYVTYGGQFENQQKAMGQLMIVVPVALLLIMILLYMSLGSIIDSSLVLLNLPFALVGGIVAILIFKMPLSVSASIAFIVLLGVAVQNGVVLMAFFRQLRERGMNTADTVRTGCDMRFRPLLMTALTSFIGHFPMLYATGSGADIQKPLAVVVMGGLVTSTVLTLVVLPVLYSIVYAPKSGKVQVDEPGKDVMQFTA